MTTTAIIPQKARIDVLAVIEGAALAESTRSKYRRAVERCINAGVDLFDAEDLANYADGLSNSGRSFLKAAVKLVTDHLAMQTKAVADRCKRRCTRWTPCRTPSRSRHRKVRRPTRG